MYKVRTLNNFLRRKLRSHYCSNKIFKKNDVSLLGLSLFLSNKHFYVGVVNREKFVTSFSTLTKSIRSFNLRHKIKVVELIGDLIISKCRELGVNQVFLYKSGYIFGGYISFFSKLLIL